LTRAARLAPNGTGREGPDVTNEAMGAAPEPNDPAAPSAAPAGARKRETLGERAERLAGSNQAMGLLALVSIAESALLPLPVDAVALPMMAAARKRIPLIVLVGALTSVIGGVIGYLIGVFGYELIGAPVISAFGQTEAFAQVRATIQENWLSGLWIIFLGAVTPIPFKLVCIGAGITGFPFWIFLPVAIGGRVLRFAVFGALFWFFGPALAHLLKRHARLVGAAMVVIIIAGFAATALLVK